MAKYIVVTVTGAEHALDPELYADANPKGLFGPVVLEGAGTGEDGVERRVYVNGNHVVTVWELP